MYSYHSRLQYSTWSPSRIENSLCDASILSVDTLPCLYEGRGGSLYLECTAAGLAGLSIEYMHLHPSPARPGQPSLRSTYLSPLCLSFPPPMDDLSNPQPRFFAVGANDRFPTKTTLQGVSTVVPSLNVLLCTSFLHGVYTRLDLTYQCHCVGVRELTSLQKALV
jgi:hypothetical protein